MAHQGTLDRFLQTKKVTYNPNTKKSKPERPKHESSRQNSHTEEIPQSDNQLNKIIMSTLVCPQLILITPADMTYYHTSQVKKLKKLVHNYSKPDALKFISENLSYQNKNLNIQNLQAIQDDTFWSMIAPLLLELTLDRLEILSGKIRMLPQMSKEVVCLTRQDALLLLTAMFFGMMPRQSHQQLVHFGELMTINDRDSCDKTNMRRQKLRCLMNYFQMRVNNQQDKDELIEIQRTSNSDMSYLTESSSSYIPMRSVLFRDIAKKTIESYYGEALMVDFANKKIGGGVLKNGCVQEEILFAIFPQAIVSKLICDQMEDEQAILIYGARLYSRYRGYSETFEFIGPYLNNKKDKQSVLVAIDALDFSKISVNSNNQYSKKNVRRQINKAFAGFQGAGLQCSEQLKACTGKWGCGAFKGDEELKFLIQWIACSVADRQMIYITEGEKIIELELLVKELIDYTILDILGIIDQYGNLRSRCNPEKLSLLNYIKQFVV